MHYSRITGDDPVQVKRKTAEDFYVWLEAAHEEEKKISKQKNGS